MIIKKPLRSERLVLRSLEPADIGNSYFRWLRDTEIIKYLEVRHAKPSVRQIKKYVEDCNRSESAYLAGIFLGKEGTHIGNIKIGPIDWRNRRGEIGILVGEKKYHGRGLALEALNRFASFCFEKLKLHKITAGCYGSNLASVNLFHRGGFQIEGIRPDHWRLGKEWETGVLFGRKRSTRRKANNRKITPVNSR